MQKIGIHLNILLAVERNAELTDIVGYAGLVDLASEMESGLQGRKLPAHKTIYPLKILH